VGGYGSSHEKGVNGGGLAQQRDQNEVTNSRSESKRNSKKVFNIICELRPKCSSTKIEKKNEEKRQEKTSCNLKLPNYISLYKLENP
jgi:thiamine kinase-like enzyme